MRKILEFFQKLQFSFFVLIRVFSCELVVYILKKCNHERNTGREAKNKETRNGQWVTESGKSIYRIFSV